MIKFSLSAPGKVILFGEHSVVYGKTAIAASIGLRTRLIYEEIEDDIISITFKPIQVIYKIQLNDLDNLIKDLKENFIDISPIMIDHDKYLKSIANFLEQFADWENLSNSQRQAIISFVYLLTAIRFYKKFSSSRGFSVTIDSDLKVGAGLGSSASFSVVLAGCFVKEITRNVTTQFSDEELCEISQWAFCSERIMHGTPSGLDNCLCTYGSIIRFRKNEEPAVLKLEKSFEALLVDTTVPRQTKNMVANVARLYNNNTSVISHILDAMDQLARDAENIITSRYNTENSRKLKELIVINQGLLQTLGVSHNSINTICKLADDKHFAAKLTGGGGGGYCIIASFDSDPYTTLELMNDLKNNGFPSVKADLGTPGLTVE